jgi:rubrerythrin
LAKSGFKFTPDRAAGVSDFKRWAKSSQSPNEEAGGIDMAHWSLADIPWEQFDPTRVDPDLLKLVKAASLVERNAEEYGKYLVSVCRDDQELLAAAPQWVAEEVQHGMALGRWAQLADPSFDFDAAFDRFRSEITLPTNAAESVRGSRVGEFVARCMVESGTSSMYTALAERAEEPVLRAIAKKIAGDEFRHYKLFYTFVRRYQAEEPMSRWRRARIAWIRAAETEDDELAFAYYAANHRADGSYDRVRYNRLYAYRAYQLYRFGHLERAVAMGFKAAGLKPHGLLNRLVARGAYGFMRWRVARIGRAEARLAAAAA